LDHFLANYGGRPYNDADRAALVTTAKQSWMDQGYAGIKYVNTSPMENATATNPTSYIVFDPDKSVKPLYGDDHHPETEKYINSFTTGGPTDGRGRWPALAGSAGGHESQIATAQSNAVKATNENYRQPSVALMAQEIKKGKDGLTPLEHNLNLFNNAKEFPNFRPDELKGSLMERAAAVEKNLATNIEFLYNHASPELQHEGQIWYQSAHNIAGQLATTNNQNFVSVAGVLARLSPQKDWDQNVEMTKRLVGIYSTKQDYKFDAAMAQQSPLTWDAGKPGKGGKPLEGDARVEKEALFKSYRDDIAGKTLGQLKDSPLLQGVWIRTYDESRALVPHIENGQLVHFDGKDMVPTKGTPDPTYRDRSYHTFLPDGSEGPIARNMPNAEFPEGKTTPLVWQTTDGIADSVRLLGSKGDPREISDYLSDAHKVRSFFNNILDPHSPNQDVTVDTHQVRASLMRGDVAAAVNQNFGNNKKALGMGAAANTVNSKGTYGFYADATRTAAKHLGVSDAQMVQAATWNVARNLFGETSDNANAAIEGIWKDYHDSKISQSEAQEKVWKLANEDVKAQSDARAVQLAKIAETRVPLHEALTASLKKEKQGKLL
jgi:hypothetical protein